MKHKRYRINFLAPVLMLFAGCGQRQTDYQGNAPLSADSSQTVTSTTSSELSHKTRKSKTALHLDSLGYINVAEADSSIAVSLMYASPENFTGERLYEDLREAYLHPDAMACLLKAQQLLRKRRPGCRLIVYDAARPMSVQQKMWVAVKRTDKKIYVSNPANGGGMHNYGLAVDVSILNEDGTPLPMGTPVDHLGKEAHITTEEILVKKGIITEEQRQNRLLLRNVMTESGFRTLPTEWWHFNYCSRPVARRNYRPIE